MLRTLILRAKPRDLLYFVIGCVIAYHEVFVADAAEPLLIFTVLFLWGLIPAFWGDRAPDVPPDPPSEPPEPRRYRDEPEPRDRHTTWARRWEPATA